MHIFFDCFCASYNGGVESLPQRQYGPVNPKYIRIYAVKPMASHAKWDKDSINPSVGSGIILP